MIDVTDAARDKLLSVLAAQEGYKYVRIGVRGGGCSGLEYSIGLVDQYEPDWTMIEFNNLMVVVDPVSMMYLDGVTVDYFESLTESGFKFNNPNVRSQCGCGKSFSV
jgi:iron-sulfur cluster assembly protein